MAGGFFLKTREAIELGILEDFRAGRKSREQASVLLGISLRAVSRRAGKVRRLGAIGVKHGNCERPPANKKSEMERERAIDLAKRIYPDFNLKHCHERLRENHDVQCSYATFRRWCVAAGLGKRRRRRPSRARLARERLANEGLMLQMDGSHHRWNGKDEWCLVAAIDDATSRIPAAQFYPSETTWACFHVLRSVISRFGVPELLYVDGAGWAGGGIKRQNFSQFVRACEELGIRIIVASSPEGKGRIERAFRTLQDRLIPELRLAGASSMVDANRYLEQVFLPSYWEKTLTVAPREAVSRYRPLALHHQLDHVLCFKHWRRVRRNHTVDLDAVTYLLTPGTLGSLSGKEVQAHIDETGNVAWYYGTQRVEAKVMTRPKSRWTGISA